MTRYQRAPEAGQQAALSQTRRITRPDFIDFTLTGLQGPMSEEERKLK